MCNCAPSHFIGVSFYQGVFGDDGTETHFEVASVPACILITQPSSKHARMQYTLYVDDREIPESLEDRN